MLLQKRISVVYFINLIKWDILIITMYAVLASTLDHYSYLRNIPIPLAISGIVATLVSLLLAFRVGQSYERWWEARIVWGGIVNDSRSLIRELQLFLPRDEESKAAIREFAERQAIWCYSLGESLRRLPPSPRVAAYLSKHGLASNNIPNLLLSKHGEQLAQVADAKRLNANFSVQLDSTLVKLTDSMGRCERIKNTVFPRSYSVLIHVLIYVFLTIFPFGLSEIYGFAELALTILIPILFVSIEQTSIIMQDPFENNPTDTPMTALAQTIETNLNEMASVESEPIVPQADTYFLM